MRIVQGPICTAEQMLGPKARVSSRSASEDEHYARHNIRGKRIFVKKNLQI